MTKLSYEQPKVRYVHVSKEAEEFVVKPLELELARVRGLLQRMFELVECGILVRDVKHDGDVLAFMKMSTLTVGTLREVQAYLASPAPPAFPQSSSLVPEGAESADIGKLDRADKSADKSLKNVVRDFLDQFGAMPSAEHVAGHYVWTAPQYEKLIALNNAYWALAESSLGQKCDVCHLTLDDMGNCFNCGSELDSDQKRDAKKRCNICGDKKCICDEYGHQNPHNSESSLSPPPPAHPNDADVKESGDDYF